MTLKELQVLVCIVQDRMGAYQLSSSLFRAGLLVNRRLTRLIKDFKRASEQNKSQ